MGTHKRWMGTRKRRTPTLAGLGYRWAQGAIFRTDYVAPARSHPGLCEDITCERCQTIRSKHLKANTPRVKDMPHVARAKRIERDALLNVPATFKLIDDRNDDYGRNDTKAARTRKLAQFDALVSAAVKSGGLVAPTSGV